VTSVTSTAAAARVGVVVGAFEDLVSLGLAELLRSDPALEVLASGVGAAELEVTLAVRRPAVAILGLGVLGTPASLRDLRRHHPDTRIVVLANRPSPTESSQLIAFGAHACLSKETQARDVLNAVHLAARGMRVLPRGTRGEALGPGEILTRREGDVLEQLKQGLSNAEIAEHLGVGIETVRSHARRLYRKLGVSSRRELASLGGGSASPPEQAPRH